MKIDERIARRVAAEFSTNPAGALAEFTMMEIKAGGMVDAEDPEKLLKRFLKPIKPYRHPVKSEFEEYILFINPDGISMRMQGSNEPRFLKELERAGVDSDLLKTIKQYVDDNERLARTLHEVERKTNALDLAREAYNRNKGKRHSTRNTAVVQTLGFTKGIPVPRFDYETVWRDYVFLVRKGGMSRIDAAQKITQDYEFNSFGATLSFLHRRRRELLEKWKQISPSQFPQIQKRIRGIVSNPGY